MASPSARKVGPTDFSLIQATLTALVEKVEHRSRKAVHHYLNVGRILRWIFDADDAYIVEDTFLVMYDIGVPPYSTSTALGEQLVLKLVGDAPFSVVPDFLEQAGREAGAAFVVVGTALALSDPALASLYQKSGYKTEAHTLVKEL